MGRRMTGKYTIATLCAILVGALVWKNNGSEVLAIVLGLVAGIVGYVVWNLFEHLLEKAMDKGAEKVGDAVSAAYRRHKDKKNN